MSELTAARVWLSHFSVIRMHVLTCISALFLACALDYSMARGQHYETTTHWYTTCGSAYGRESPRAQKLVQKSWYPLVGFFFTKEGHQDPAIAEGVTTFFQRYAECGLSEYGP